MTAAVEEVSSRCEAIQEELDKAFSTVRAAVQHLSMSRCKDLHPINGVRNKPNNANDSERSLRSQGSKHARSVAASTRKLRSHTTGLTSPANLQPMDIKRPELPCRKGMTRELSKSAEPVISSCSKPRKRSTKVSPHFDNLPAQRTKPSLKVSCVPFPPLHSTSFGLVQERLSHDPFRLLVACIFLNKTRGAVALPVFYELMERYPTPADLAVAKHEDVVEIIQHLGLQNQRTKKCINLAKAWCERPPQKAKRYRLLHYPKQGDGKDVKPDEILGEDDERVAWEVGQLPGIGAYAIDSWRIFCRDELRGLQHGLPNRIDEASKGTELQKEWARVVPMDKELRAYLRWRWLRNGWVWDPLTGEKRRANEEELEKAKEGGTICEGEDMGVVIAEDESKELDNILRRKDRDLI